MAAAQDIVATGTTFNANLKCDEYRSGIYDGQRDEHRIKIRGIDIGASYDTWGNKTPESYNHVARLNADYCKGAIALYKQLLTDGRSAVFTAILQGVQGGVWDQADHIKLSKFDIISNSDKALKTVLGPKLLKYGLAVIGQQHGEKASLRNDIEQMVLPEYERVINKYIDDELRCCEMLEGQNEYV